MTNEEIEEIAQNILASSTRGLEPGEEIDRAWLRKALDGEIDPEEDFALVVERVALAIEACAPDPLQGQGRK